MKYLIVGLGNPTQEYWGTRHNIGFRIANEVASQIGATFSDEKHGAVATGRIKNQEVVLLKPSTFMNLSGTAVRYWLQQLKIDPKNLLILVDDLAFDFGTIRLKPSGSHAGHNGLRHITEMLKSDAYARLRFGIGSDFPRGRQVDYVLGKFTEGEEARMSVLMDRCVEMVNAFVLSGLEFAMNHYNKKPLPDE